MGVIPYKEKIQAKILMLNIQKAEIQEKRKLLLKQLNKITGKKFNYEIDNEFDYEEEYEDKGKNEEYEIEPHYIETERGLLEE